MKAYGGVDVYIHIFLTFALDAGEWSQSRPVHLLKYGQVPNREEAVNFLNANFDGVKKQE
jgi:hypothetical protein